MKKISNLFKSLVTYNDSVVNSKTIIKGNIGDFYLQELPYKNDFKKRKLVAIIANNRDDNMVSGDKRQKGELYSQRKIAVQYFQEKCPKDFDLYGNFWPNDLKKCWRRAVKRYEKQKVISRYRFLISYDSITHQKGYISEKIFDCFKAKTVPVYWGADNVTDYIPKECFIDRRDFETYDELYDFLKNMDEKIYNQYITNIEKYLKSELFNKYFSSEASARVLYNELKKAPRKVSQLKAKRILREFDHKRYSNINGIYRYDFDNNYYDYHRPSYIKITCDFIELPSNVGNLPVDYLLTFVSYHSNNIKPSFYYNFSGHLHLLKSTTTTITEVYHGAKTTFTFKVSDLMRQKKTRFYYFDGENYHLLNISSNIDWSSFEKAFRLKIKQQYFYYHITLVRRIARKIKTLLS